MKVTLKDLMMTLMMLMMFLIFLSYIKETNQRITRVENMNKTIIRTRNNFDYYQKLKRVIPIPSGGSPNIRIQE